METNRLRAGDFIQIKDRPCKIVSIDKNKHNKILGAAIDVFTNKKYYFSFSSKQDVWSPQLKRKKCLLYNIAADGSIYIIDENNELSEINIGQNIDVGDPIEQDIYVEIISAPIGFNNDKYYIKKGIIDVM